MSKIHVLEGQVNGKYHFVIHTPTPAGNNSVGVSWVTAGLNSGFTGKTSLTIGTGAGQISAAENTTVLNGTVIEIPANIDAESNGSPPSQATLNQIVDEIISNYLGILAIQLKYFGYTQG